MNKTKPYYQKILGWWARVEDSSGVNSYNNVDTIISHDEYGITVYAPHSRGYPMQNGYLVGCTDDDWNICHQEHCYIDRWGMAYNDGCRYGKYTLIDDKLYWESGDFWVIFQKVKGFK